LKSNTNLSWKLAANPQIASYTLLPDQDALARIGQHWVRKITMFLKLFFVFMICLLATLSQSCAQVNVKKMTYQALRQHDCRINQPDTICARNYSADYHEYERMRKKLLTDKHSGQFRVKLIDRPSDPQHFKQ